MRPDPSGRTLGRADDALAARLLADGAMRSVLGVFLGRTCSAREAAGELGRDLDAVLYRIRRLREAGLLEIAGVRRRSGRPVKLYRSRADAWFVPFEALPYADVEETLAAMHHTHAERLASAAARSLVRTPWAGFMVRRGADGRVWMHGSAGGQADGAPGPAAPLAGLGSHLGERLDVADAAVELRLTPEQSEALNRELLELVGRYLAMGGPTEGTPNRLLVVASVPLTEP